MSIENATVALLDEVFLTTQTVQGKEGSPFWRACALAVGRWSDDPAIHSTFDPVLSPKLIEPLATELGDGASWRPLIRKLVWDMKGHILVVRRPIPYHVGEVILMFGAIQSFALLSKVLEECDVPARDVVMTVLSLDSLIDYILPDELVDVVQGNIPSEWLVQQIRMRLRAEKQR